MPGELVRTMTAALQHRGPDGDGLYLNGQVGLGHRRLSIIDIGGGAQPIANEDGTIQVTFNGEIYNFIELRAELEKAGHIFKTHADTEVIVHGYEEWGLDCFARFNGMFAIGLWDGPSRKLILARDHLGIKPLYYAALGKQLLFASEIKALLSDKRCPRTVNLDALAQLFTLRYVPAPSTLFHGINKLPPAHLLIADAREVTLKQYWKWTPHIQRQPANEEALAEQYRELVADAVRLQMRSDVPVGLFLSSGVDSAALLALMSRHADTPVRTFTIGFEEGEKTNELADAKQLAAMYGSAHSELTVTPRDYERYFERYLWDIEEPVGNETAAAFYFVANLAHRQVKVALTGQGADELWAGYHRHLGVKLSQLYSKCPPLLTESLLTPLVQRYSKNERWKRGVLSLSEPDVLTRFVKVYSFYSSEMKTNLFQPWLAAEISVDGVEARRALTRLHGDVKGLDALSQILYMDTRSNLPDDLLMVGDKTAMANSLEARVPFLDYRLVEFVETLPPGLKIRGLRGKYLHKKALAKWLPREVVHRKKKGFANPIHQWLRAGMNGFVKDCLLSDTCAVRHYFNQDYMRRLHADHMAGRQHHLRHLYLLISLEMWHQRFGITY